MKPLTKSHFLQYLNCPYAFHYLAAHPEHRLVVTDADRFTMEEGIQFEKVVIDVFDQTNSQTQFEFQTDLYYAKTDIVKFLGDKKVELFEIKASSSVKNEYVWDIAFQRFVAEQAGYDVVNVFLVYVNKAYVYDGIVHTSDLFQLYDIEREVMEVSDEIENLAIQAHAFLNQNDTPGGQHQCGLKIKCPYLVNTEIIPDYPISAIPRITKNKFWEMWQHGVKSIDEIPDEVQFSAKQQAAIDVMKGRSIMIDKMTLKMELDTLEFPLYFLDYETYQPALPIFNGYQPYEKFVFQYSLHIIETPNAAPAHVDYMMTHDNLDVSNLIRNLESNISDHGSIIAWNASFEKSCHRNMAAHHPAHATFLLNLNARIWDLMLIFKNGMYRHHAFKGSNSIKDVLPVLCPDLSHQDLPVSDGATASFQWKKAVLEGHPKYPYNDTIRNLLEYCKLDTWAMVRLWEELGKMCS